MSREQLKDKFLNTKHKWIFYEIDSNVFDLVLNVITKSINQKEVSSKNSMALIKSFKFHEKVFIKYKRATGRSNINCECEIINKENEKISFFLPVNVVLNGELLNGTPKSLKLYKSGKKDKGVWKKPNDGFIDPISYPAIEEELTELGYKLYKSFQEELKESGLTLKQYVIKMHGYEKYYKNMF